MRINTALQKMREGKPAFGYALGLGSMVAAEALANCGIDFLLLDRQHGSWGEDSTIAGLIAMHGGTATPMARVSRNDYTMIGRLLDEGCMGIIVPMVHTAEDAKAAADACRLPPTGTRSWGWGRAAIFGATYPDLVNDQTFVAVQIESRQAVENVEAIMATPGVDGCWTGPGDMALSMGIDPRKAHESDEHARALEKIVQACKNTGKIPGIAAGGIENAKQRAEQGFQFIVAAG
ncbi:MAG: HpcH/HpaI aldolase/citrate lyase family protein, partial [Chloroflexota bacterium]